MATVDGAPDGQAVEDLVPARVRRLREQALVLLPGVLALFAFQILGLLRPAQASIATLPHFALLSSATWTAGSVLLLGILLSQRPVLRIPEGAQRVMRTFGWMLAVARGACWRHVCMRPERLISESLFEAVFVPVERG